LFLQALLIVRDMFESFARGFGSPEAITGLHLSGPTVLGRTGELVNLPPRAFSLTTFSVGFIVQLFYA
jgi:hypothetical protein